MKAALILLIALCSRLSGGEITSAEYTDESQQTIRFTIDGKERDLTAPKGRFWDHLLVCKNKTAAFFVLNRGDRKKGSWIEDLQRFSADPDDGRENPSPIPLDTELREAKVLEIFDASDDGSRLLVNLHYSYKKEGDSTFYRSYPYFLETKDGKLTPVKP